MTIVAVFGGDPKRKRRGGGERFRTTGCGGCVGGRGRRTAVRGELLRGS